MFFCALSRNGVLAVILLAAFFFQSARASELIYTPINPSFGGNPSNGPDLLSVANAQNGTRAPSTAVSQLQSFNTALQNALLSHAESLIVSNANANSGLPTPGTYLAGAYTVTITAETGSGTISGISFNAGDLVVTTTVNATGAQASFVIGQ
jgi:curli production assembly/transport component CsgF